MKPIRQIVFYKNYFEVFFASLEEKLKDKIDEVLYMITVIERVPTKYLKSIEGIKGLFEIRVEYQSNTYRIFCCFDKGQLVVLFNGFQKKSQKTPKQELSKAHKLMREYFTDKENEKE